MSENGDAKHDEEVYITTEKELVEVSNYIENVGKKLAVLKPKQRPKEADESLNFEEQILEAAKSITAAVGTLVKAATLAQKELVTTGKVTTPGCDDLNWSANLINAARKCGQATGALCEAANDAVQGTPSEEKLVAAARAVADSTGVLLEGCVASDSSSKAQKGLQSAGEAVKRAAGALVDAATGSVFFKKVEEEKLEEIMSVNDQKMKEEIAMQENILRLEKELKKAQARLHHIREINRQRNADEEGSEND